MKNETGCIVLYLLYLYWIPIDANIRLAYGKSLCPGQTPPLSTAFQIHGAESLIRCTQKCYEEDHCFSASYRKFDKKCFLFTTYVADDCLGLITDPMVKYLIKVYPIVCFNGGTVTSNVSRPCTCTNSYVGSRCQRRMRDCEDGRESGYYNENKVYSIKPLTASKIYHINCSLKNKGSLMVAINYNKGTPSFNKSWTSMKNGFGSTTQAYWIGLEALHHFTINRPHRLFIHITAVSDMYVKDISLYKVYGIYYNNFYVESENNNYRMTFSGTSPYGKYPGDSMTDLNGSSFSTYDRDNDNDSTRNCALEYGAPYWFNACAVCNPFGKVTLDKDPFDIPRRLFWTNTIESVDGQLPIIIRMFLFKMK